MAISKIGSNAVDTLSSKLTLTAADGVEDNDYIMELTNAEATDGRSFGISAGHGQIAHTRQLNFFKALYQNNKQIITIDEQMRRVLSL